MIIENIADLHFGRTGNEEKMYDELKNTFIKHCNEVQPDIIFLNGDCYDSRQLIDSPANIYFNKFIDDCIATGAIIVISEGTESHDRHQINALSHYASNKFIIINTVTKLNLLGLKFLIIPEEYVKDDSYYKDYFNDKYDFLPDSPIYRVQGIASDSGSGLSDVRYAIVSGSGSAPSESVVTGSNGLGYWISCDGLASWKANVD